MIEVMDQQSVSDLDSPAANVIKICQPLKKKIVLEKTNQNIPIKVQFQRKLMRANLNVQAVKQSLKRHVLSVHEGMYQM